MSRSSSVIVDLKDDDFNGIGDDISHFPTALPATIAAPYKKISFLSVPELNKFKDECIEYLPKQLIRPFPVLLHPNRLGQIAIA